MASGFSFRGTHSSRFGVYYIPDYSKMFDDRAEVSVYDNDIDWRDGGIYYGKRAKPRVFELDCFYEDLDARTYNQMKQWLDAGSEGRLILDESPWKYYDVVLSKTMTGKKYIHQDEDSMKPLYSGTFTVTLTAYDPPYGKLLYQAVDQEDIHSSGAISECGIIPKENMPAAPSVNDRSFLIYNCGTRMTPCTIRIGGTTDADGITITNETNGSACRISALPPETAYLEINSEDGSVKVVDPLTSSSEIAFEYHDLGYITLSPCESVFDEFMIQYTSGSSTAAIGSVVDAKQYIGKYILVSGQWLRIIDATHDTITVHENFRSSGMAMVVPATMNSLSINGNATLNRLEVDWTPWVK